jgi:hypothetical protein
MANVYDFRCPTCRHNPLALVKKQEPEIIDLTVDEPLLPQEEAPAPPQEAPAPQEDLPLDLLRVLTTISRKRGRYDDLLSMFDDGSDRRLLRQALRMTFS